MDLPVGLVATVVVILVAGTGLLAISLLSLALLPIGVLAMRLAMLIMLLTFRPPSRR